MVSLIVAYDRQRGIGWRNRLPWRLPADLAHFKRLSLGKPVVMGRRTFESIGRPLPGRRNVVVSGTLTPGDLVEVVPTLEAALAACATAPETLVIGGARVYAAALPVADRVLATEIDATFEVDAYFPALPGHSWRESARAHRPADAANPHAMDFVVYERRK